MNAIEPRERVPQGTMEPPRPMPSFVFIDLREDIEAWTRIEDELPVDARFTAH